MRHCALPAQLQTSQGFANCAFLLKISCSAGLGRSWLWLCSLACPLPLAWDFFGSHTHLTAVCAAKKCIIPTLPALSSQPLHTASRHPAGDCDRRWQQLHLFNFPSPWVFVSQGLSGHSTVARQVACCSVHVCLQLNPVLQGASVFFSLSGRKPV